MKQRSIFAIVLVALWMVLCLQGAQAAKSGDNDLILLNWEEYFDPAILALFEKRHGVKVKEVYFETDETRDEMLAQTNGEKYDMVLVSSHKVESYVRRGWLAPVTTEGVPHIKHVEQRWRGTHPQVATHAVPVFWGTLGIGYRGDIISEKITSWKQLFHPKPEWRKKIIMVKDSTDLYGMALKSLGYSMNSAEAEPLAAAEALLMAQKPFVKTYGYPSLGKDSGLVTGEYHMAMLYNGDAISLRKSQPEIVYVAPEEGTNLWVDSLGVLEKSERKELAWLFINFIHEPEIAARMSLFSHFATVNEAATPHLPKEHLTNPVIYPAAEVLERSEFSQTHPPKVMRRINSGFSRLMR